jgi:hypothetical protein
MAFTGNTAWYISSARYAAVTTWATGQAKAVGDIVKQSGTPTVGNERCYVAVAAGTTGGGADPLTTFTRGVKITDNTVTWQEATGAPALNGDLTNTPSWNSVKNTAVSLGHVIKDVAGTHIFICTTAGTAGNGAEPSWSTGTAGNTTADNTVTWTYIGTGFTKWSAPHARAQNALASNWGDTGTKFYYGDDHAESQSTSISLTTRGTDAAPIDFICVDHLGSTPPVSADLKTTAAVTTTGSSGISISGALRVCYGLNFTAGTSGGISLNYNNDGAAKFYDSCSFALGAGTASGATLTSSDSYVEWRNCTVKFSNASQSINPQGRLVWRDGGGLDGSGTIPTGGLFKPQSRSVVHCRGIDLSPLTTNPVFAIGVTVLFDGLIEDCDVDAAVVLLSPNSGGKQQRVRMVRSDGAGHSYRIEAADLDGALTTEKSVALTGGATIDGTAVSWKIATTSKPNLGRPFVTPPFSKYNPTTGSSMTATVYGVANAAAVPNSDELWLSVSYPGSSGSPVASEKSSGVADFLATGSGLTADASAWDSAASARVDTHAYVVGDVVKLASNPGRVFFCTTAGTSAGSEPGGYSSAVDGGSVTDGTAVFRAGCRFKMTATLTSPNPQLAGLVRAVVKAAKQSATLFVDPTLNLA